MKDPKTLLTYEFEYVQELAPVTDIHGVIKLFSPAEKYNNVKNRKLLSVGTGPFAASQSIRNGHRYLAFMRFSLMMSFDISDSVWTLPSASTRDMARSRRGAVMRADNRPTVR